MATLALYRAYRPGRFADVVGQDHVTEPLSRALRADRVHHAYLFSGPRGCGKTSSARILARSLNCEQGPTPEPCGQCQSCRDLAPGGAGSMDVVELDAATHGLVDDARDLREKAHFAPLASRFKIYIIDEAHQLGPGAANALLKLIEEPPAHLKFVFATTAPDKILGTIRSRTHHYPFRLIPARTLQRNLAWICEQEGVTIEPAALALVARAGAGSARDAQSILGQLIAGSGPEGVTHELAVALLGFTDAALLDAVVDAIAVSDGASVFAAIDRVMDSGHDPRRFLTDLLERFRDLIVIGQVPDALSSGLIDAPDEQGQRLSAQASRLGASDLVRLADVVDLGITAMKGATPTRLQLELVCARLLLPAVDDSHLGLQSRLDRLERRLSLSDAAPVTSAPAAAAPPAAPASAPSAPPSRPVPEEVSRPDPEPVSSVDPVEPEPPVAPSPDDADADAPGVAVAEPDASVPQPDVEQAPSGEEPGFAASVDATPAAGPAAEPTPEPTPAIAPDPTPAADQEPPPASAAPVETAPVEPVTPAAAEPAPATGGGDSGLTAQIRDLWPDVMNRLKEIKRTPWSLIAQEASVVEVQDGVLTLAFRIPTLRDTFMRREEFQTFLRQAITDTLGRDLRVAAIVDPSVAAGGASAAGGPSASGHGGSTGSGGGAGGVGGAGAAPQQVPPPSGRADAAKAAVRRIPAPNQRQDADATPEAAVGDGDATPEDADVEDTGLSERELVQRTLGATVIEEIQHDR